MLSYQCIVISLFIPIISAAFAKFSIKGYNNKNPREFLGNLKGHGKRANFAQINFYETFPAFAIGVVVAHQLNASVSTIDQLAIIYVLARIGYAFFYIMDNHILRTLSWFIAFSAILGLYFISF